MYDGEITDAHHHLWDLGHNYYPWLVDEVGDYWFGDYSSIRRDYLVDDYLRDCSGHRVAKSVHLQALWDPRDPAGESRWLQECHDRTGFPTGIVGYANLADPDVERLIDAHLACASLKGLRMDLNWHEDPRYRFCDRADYMSDPAWLDGFSLVEKHGLSFDLQIYAARQFRDALIFVGRFPGVQFVLDHAGLPADRSASGLAAWREALRALAELPNLAVKLSGFGMFDHGWSTASIAPFVLDVIGIFGVERCLFASNFPVEGLYGSYDRLFRAFKQIVRNFSPEEQRGLFRDNADRCYRI